MIANLLRKVNLPLFILGVLVCMTLGSLSCWAYILGLKTEVRSAIRKSEEKRPDSKQKAAATAATPTPAPTETPDDEMEDDDYSDLGNSPAALREAQRKRWLRARRRPKAPSNLPTDLQDLVKSKHLFGVPVDAVMLQAILGDSALINNQWIKIGQEIDGIKLEELSNDVAVVTLNGEKQDVPLWSPLPGSGEPGAPPAKSGRGFGKGSRSFGGGGGSSGMRGGVGRGDRKPLSQMTDEETQRMRDERRAMRGQTSDQRSQPGSSPPAASLPSAPSAQSTPASDRSRNSDRSNDRSGDRSGDRSRGLDRQPRSDRPLNQDRIPNPRKGN